MKIFDLLPRITSMPVISVYGSQRRLSHSVPGCTGEPPPTLRSPGTTRNQRHTSQWATISISLAEDTSVVTNQTTYNHLCLRLTEILCYNFILVVSYIINSFSDVAAQYINSEYVLVNHPMIVGKTWHWKFSRVTDFSFWKVNLNR